MNERPKNRVQHALDALATANRELGKSAEFEGDRVAFVMALVVGGLIAAVRDRRVSDAEMERLRDRVDAWELGN